MLHLRYSISVYPVRCLAEWETVVSVSPGENMCCRVEHLMCYMFTRGWIGKSCDYVRTVSITQPITRGEVRRKVK